MAIKSVLSSVLSRPAGKVVEAPVRDLVSEMLDERRLASQADVEALRTGVEELRRSVDDLKVRLGRVDGLEQRLGTVETEAAALGEAAMALAARSEVLVNEVERVLQRDRAGRQASVATGVAPACRVDGCKSAVNKAGFCEAHHEKWTAGTLKGFVSPEGLVEVAGKPHRVAKKLAGLPYAVAAGKKAGLTIDGSVVTPKPL